jgi:hypothetical protein
MDLIASSPLRLTTGTNPVEKQKRKVATGGFAFGLTKDLFECGKAGSKDCGSGRRYLPP